MDQDEEPPPRVTAPGVRPQPDPGDIKGPMDTTFWRIVLGVLVIAAIVGLVAMLRA